MKLTNQMFLHQIDNRNNSMNIKNNKLNTLERTPAADNVNFTGAPTGLQSEFINKVLKGNTFDNILSSFNFARYEDYGIPLKYSRRKFVREVQASIGNLHDTKQNSLLEKFGLYKGPKDIEGVPIIPKEIENTPEFLSIARSINNLTVGNEMETRHRHVKPLIDTILNGFPEFTSIIGKKQHGTHIYSVDIHSLKLLQSAMQNPKYEKLSDDSKAVLKFTTLLHDFGKQGGVITPGHAAQSKVYAEKILTDFPLPDTLKQRILLHVENHHWFENYNRGFISADDVCNIYNTKEDLEIAKILAKGDFENVNPEFHLNRMVSGKTITQQEFDNIFAKAIDKIQV